MEALKSGGMTPPIPSEIITEILYRLPVKSVGRFRSVSKDWLSQLTDPQFIKTHKEKTLKQHHLIISSCNDLYSLPFHQNPEEEEEEEAILSTPTKLPVDTHDYITVQGCCNGLVLVSISGSSYSLVVLNPTTGEFLELPYLNYDIVDYEDTFMFVLGYDSVTDDYKVVALSLPHCMDVYSLKNNTWKSVSYDTWKSEIYYPLYFFGGMRLSEALVNGCLHWLATKGSDEEVLVIVAFSFKDDNFTQIALPNIGNDIDVINDCRVGSVGGKLVVFVAVQGAVWLMKEYGVKESWTKILLHGFIDIPTDVLPMVFDVHGKILLVRGRKMWIYNLEDGSLCKHIDTSRYLKGMNVEWICVESLVPLPKVQSDESTDPVQVKTDSKSGPEEQSKAMEGRPKRNRKLPARFRE